MQLPLLRRLLAGVIAALMMAACAGPKPDAALFQPGELVIYYQGFNWRDGALDELSAAYTTRRPHVQVFLREFLEWDLIAEDGSIDQSLLEGGDLVLVSNTALADLHKAGLVRPLSGVKTPPINPVIASSFDELTQAQGTLAALPAIIQPTVITYNPGKLHRAGVTVPTDDWTLADWEAAQAKLREAGVAEEFYPADWLEPVMGAFGTRLYDPNGGGWQLGSPAGREALAWIARQVAENPQPDRSQPRFIFSGGSLAPPWQVYQITAAPQPFMRIVPFPSGPAGRSVPVEATVGIVLRDAPNAVFAQDFLTQMLLGADGQRQMARLGYMPVVDDGEAVAMWRQAVGEKTASMFELSLADAYVGQRLPLRELEETLLPYFEGTRSLEAVLDDIEQVIQP